MENNNINNQQPQNEIDLIDLMKNLYNFCRTNIKAFFTFLLRQSVWLVGFGILGIGFSIFLSLNSKKYYSSSVQILSNNVNCNYVIAQIDALDGLLAKEDYQQLSSLLDIPESILPDVKSIKALHAIDANKDSIPDYMDELELAKRNPRDTSIRKMNNYFYLKLEVFSEQAFAPIAKSLTQYLNKSKLLTKENTYSVLQKKLMLDEVKKQVSLLDSFQKVEYFIDSRGKTAASQQTVFMSEKDKKLYHKDILGLYKQQLRLEKELELYSNVITITQDFPPLSAPENTLGLYLKKYVWKFVLAGFLFSVLWYYRKPLSSAILRK